MQTVFNVEIELISAIRRNIMEMSDSNDSHAVGPRRILNQLGVFVDIRTRIGGPRPQLASQSEAGVAESRPMRGRGSPHLASTLMTVGSAGRVSGARHTRDARHEDEMRASVLLCHAL